MKLKPGLQSQPDRNELAAPAPRCLSCLSANRIVNVILAMDSEIKIKISNDQADDKKLDANLTPHVKRVVLDYLKKHGCTRENLETTAHARRHSSQLIIGKKDALNYVVQLIYFPPRFILP